MEFHATKLVIIICGRRSNQRCTSKRGAFSYLLKMLVNFVDIVSRLGNNQARLVVSLTANDVALVTVEWWDCCRPLYISKLALSSGYLLQDNTTRTTDV